MGNITLFERERRAQAHREELAMLEAERAAVDRLAKSYELMAFALLAFIDAREKLSGPGALTETLGGDSRAGVHLGEGQR